MISVWFYTEPIRGSLLAYVTHFWDEAFYRHEESLNISVDMTKAATGIWLAPQNLQLGCHIPTPAPLGSFATVWPLISNQ